MGFLGPEKKIVDELKAKLDPRGNLETPKNKYSTSIPNVYAAGGESTDVGQSYHCSLIKRLCSEHASIYLGSHEPKAEMSCSDQILSIVHCHQCIMN